MYVDEDGVVVVYVVAFQLVPPFVENSIFIGYAVPVPKVATFTFIVAVVYADKL